MGDFQKISVQVNVTRKFGWETLKNFRNILTYKYKSSKP